MWHRLMSSQNALQMVKRWCRRCEPGESELRTTKPHFFYMLLVTVNKILMPINITSRNYNGWPVFKVESSCFTIAIKIKRCALAMTPSNADVGTTMWWFGGGIPLWVVIFFIFRIRSPFVVVAVAVFGPQSRDKMFFLSYANHVSIIII